MWRDLELLFYNGRLTTPRAAAAALLSWVCKILALPRRPNVFEARGMGCNLSAWERKHGVNTIKHL